MLIALKKLREQKGLTQTELAKKFTVGQSTIAMWESGEAMPRADKLPLLAKILECSIDDFFRKDEENQEEQEDQEPLSVIA